MSLSRSVFTIGGWTLLSRVLGMARDIVTAAFLGAGPVADAFFVAFRLPNMFRALFAEGAFSLVFVPRFAAKLTQQGRAAAMQFAEESMALLLLGLVLLVVMGEGLMDYLLPVIAPGFKQDPAQFALAVDFARITFPYILLISMTAFYGGILNALDKFYAFAIAPCIMNLVMMLSLVLLSHFTETPGHALAIGVILAGIAQFAFLRHEAARENIALRFRVPKWTPESKALVIAILPVALGSSAYQINLLVGTMLGSFLPDGAISHLYYADRVAQLPLGIVGIAVGTALLPILAKIVAQGDEAGAIDQQNRAIGITWALTLPAAVALFLIPGPVIQVLFERGEFSPHSTHETAIALMGFAVGIPAFVLIKALNPGFFARSDAKTPVKIAFLCVAINAALNLFLIGPFGHVGIALGTSISSWINFLILAQILNKRGHLKIDANLKAILIKAAIAAAIMGAVLIAMKFALAPWFWGGSFKAFSALAILVIAGMTAYFVLVFLLGAVKMQDFRQLLRRGS